MGWIKQEVSQRQGSSSSSRRNGTARSGDDVPPGVSPTNANPHWAAFGLREGNSALENFLSFDPEQEAQWQRLHANLYLAEQNADAGALLPEMGRFRGMTRKLARQAARGLLYLARVFTNPQRRFNTAALAALGDLVFRFEQAELDHRQTELDHRRTELDHQEQLEHGRQALVDLKVRYRKLEKEIAELRAHAAGPVQASSPGQAAGCPSGAGDGLRQTVAAGATGLNLDALYVAFEARFRGNREDIKERLKVYIPLLRDSAVGTDAMPLLDLGCGRGEWLELLGDEGLRAQGVDANDAMAEVSRQQGLEVHTGDALAYLRGLSDTSVGAVTGFHIIEHLPFATFLELLDETVRVLKPGGLALFETPNPENVLVSICTFHIDPTHVKPLPSHLVQFLAEARGLSRTKVLHQNPYPDHMRLGGSELADRFSDFFYGPRDYAVVGWKV